MRIGDLVLRLRETTQLFSGRVGGAAEYAIAKDVPLTDEAAFVIPMADVASENEHDSAILQKIKEQYAVVVAIRNDTNFKDKTGFAAYNRLHEVRRDLFAAFLGYDAGRMSKAVDAYSQESLIYYKGGQLLDMDSAYMWYQFTFEYDVQVMSQATYDAPDGYLDKIHAQYVLAEFSDNLPVTEDLPVTSFAPHMEQLVDLQAERDET